MRFRVFLVTIGLLLILQNKAGIVPAGKAFVRPTVNAPELTISYRIDVSNATKTTGIKDTYSGGIKTIFISGNKARVRQVSLMRMQNIFITRDTVKKTEAVIIAKESGPKKYLVNLNNTDWKAYNNKYDSARFEISISDTATIAGYLCFKGNLVLKDKRSIEIWYTTTLKNNIIKYTEPFFNFVPGVILKYSYITPKGTLSYTAENISTKVISKAVFNIPLKGYQKVKYIHGQPPIPIGDLLNDTDDDDDDDDEEGI